MESARCKAFLASAETGSFSRAAEKLRYTPSGVSQLVTALEQDLGFPLLRRTRRGVTLTDAGEKLLPAIRGFLRQEERIYQLAAEVKGLAVGHITIATYSSIATHWLPQVIRDFQQDYPNIELSIIEGIRQEVVQALDESRADVGFLSVQEEMPYDWIPLAEDTMLAVLPKDHPLAGADRYPLARCSEEDFIMPAMGRDADIAPMLERNHITPNIRYATVETFTALTMIENGLGMTVTNELITRNWVCDVVMLPLDPPQQVTFGMAIPSLDHATPAVRRFVEYAVRALSRGEGT